MSSARTPTYAISRTEHGARTGQHRRLGEQLPNDAAAGGAERYPHGHFPCAGCAAREQEVRDVDAREQEQQAGRRHHNRQDRPEIADHRGNQWLRHIGSIGVGRRKVPGQSLHDRRHFRVGAFQRHTRLSAA